MPRTLLASLVTAAGLAAAPVAHAAVLAEYDFDTTTGSNLFPNNGDTGSWTVSPTLTFGAGLASGGGAFGQFDTGDSVDYGNTSATDSKSLQVGGPRANATLLSSAITQNDYFGFTLTPGAVALDLSSFFFTAVGQVDTNTGQVSANAPSDYAIFVGAPGFSASSVTPLATGAITQAIAGGTQPDQAFQQISANISGSAYDAVSSPLEFRVYLWGGGSGAASLIDNVILTGAPVPEPASLSLLALAGLAGMRRRRS